MELQTRVHQCKDEDVHQKNSLLTVVLLSFQDTSRQPDHSYALPKTDHGK